MPDTDSALTTTLCAALTTQAARPLPAAVAREAQRSLLNVVGTAVGASREPAVDLVIAHASEHGGDPAAPILGRSERTDMLHAALAVGLAAHLDDFDDTHLETVIHPGAATLAAVLAMSTQRSVTGEAALTAFALGCEAQLRIGAAMSPSHYDAGWHITGTCGVIGAAVAAGLLAELSTEELGHAVAVAASQTLGLRDAFGTMTKPFHPGKAAWNGVLAVLLADSGFTGAPDVLEHRQGYFTVLADDVDPARVTAGWDGEWELLRNTYKPYPCGIVIHPVIDAAIELHDGITSPSEIDEVIVSCHPLVVELTGNPDPTDGLEARFSAIHGAAAGLVDGAVGLPQYADDRVRAKDLVALRSKVRLEVDASLDRDAAAIEVRVGGNSQQAHVPHARGSLARPLSDDELHEKVRALVEPVLPGATQAVVDAVEGLGHAADLSELIEAATPRAVGETSR